MATIDESGLVGKVRDRPINQKLRDVLVKAAEAADIDRVVITSGGQPGSTGRRIGSTRHDGGNAADLQLVMNDHVLDFTDPDDRPIVERFIMAAARHGATGIGAGVDYMGSTTLHIGFGRSPADHKKIVWGAGGEAVNAPGWLKAAAAEGWERMTDRGEVWASGEAEFEEEVFAAGSSSTVLPIGTRAMATSAEVRRFTPFLDFIARHEGTADRPDSGYNTSLGFGRFIRGGEKDLVNMTLDEINELQLEMLRHPKNTLDSSALGRYQIVRKTLLGLRTQFGLSGSQKFSADLQDRLAVALIKRRGRSIDGLRNEWASLKSVPGEEILRAYDGVGPAITIRSEPKPEMPNNVPPEFWDFVVTFMNDMQGKGKMEQVQSDWPTLELGARSEGVERLQRILNELNYHTGGLDGKFGTLTRGAVAAFQLDNGLVATGMVDARTWAALTKASPRPLAQERVAVTADDLRRMGSVTIKNADRSRYAGWATALLGALGLTNAGAAYLGGTTAVTSAAQALPTNVITPASLIQAITSIRSDPTLPSNPNVSQALGTIEQILSRITTTTSAAPPQTPASPLGGIGEIVLPVLSSIVPGPLGSVLTLGLGFFLHRFGSNIISRRVANQRDAVNVGSTGS
jgi:peptidoglycan hydrolase-like protein with peptidoglycan-binding domain/muramidase (phage lysozyme)